MKNIVDDGEQKRLLFWFDNRKSKVCNGQEQALSRSLPKINAQKTGAKTDPCILVHC